MLALHAIPDNKYAQLTEKMSAHFGRRYEFRTTNEFGIEDGYMYEKYDGGAWNKGSRLSFWKEWAEDKGYLPR